MDIVITVVAFLVVLGLLVLVHELGHFLTARLFKVRVEEFGFGFPSEPRQTWGSGSNENTAIRLDGRL